MADTLKYRQITGLFTARLPDGSDADEHPDTVRLSGRVTFHPEYKKPLVFPGEHIVLEPIPALLVDGQLMVEVLQGDDVVLQDLYLPVTMDDAANQTWSWTMRFHGMTLGQYGETVELPDVRFVIEEGDGPLDLSTVPQTTARASSNFITRGAPGAGLQEITAENGELVFQWDNGRSTTIDVPDSIPGRPGDKGDPGDVRFEGIDPGITVRTDDVLIGDVTVPSVEYMQENAYNKGIVLDGATLDALPTGAHWVDTTAAATSLGLPAQWRGSLNVVRRDGSNATVEYTTRATPPRKYHTTRFSDGWRDWELVPRSTQATPTEDGLMPAGDKAKLDEVPAPASIATQVYVGDQIAAIPTATPTDAGLMSAADKNRMRHTPQEVATPTDWRLAETDEDGKISRAVDAEGRTWLTPHPDTPGIADTRVAGQIQHVSTDDWVWAVADEAGQVALGVRTDGTTYTGGDDSAPDPYDVVLVIGQSNARGAGSPVPEPDPWAGIDQYPAANHAGAGTIVPAVDPLLHQDPRLVGAGFALPFARRYRQEHPDRQVLIVPSAYGATGFSTSAPAQGGTWDWTAPDDGTNLAVNAVRQTQDALTAAGSGARLVGILWHQGEGDGSIAADYHLYLDGLIAWLRDQLDAPDVPFVVGQMSPDRQGGGNGVTIDAAHQMTPARVERTAFAPTPAGLHNYGDATHLATRGLQKVGLNFFDALERAEFNTYGGGPIGVEDLRARRSGDTVTVEWRPAWCRVTEYRVEWRTVGGTWSQASVTHSPSLATSATIAEAAAIEVRVITVNETGESTPVHTSA